MTYLGFIQTRIDLIASISETITLCTSYFFFVVVVQIYHKTPPPTLLSQGKNMLSVLQMSKLNHMADKFDLFLIDRDLNKTNTVLK